MADAIRLAPTFLVFTALFLNSILSKDVRNNGNHRCSSLANCFSHLLHAKQFISKRKRREIKTQPTRRRSDSSRKILHLLVLLLLLSNDIELNPGPGSTALKSCMLNARSIVNKRLELQALVNTKEIELLAITETWLNADILDNEILSSGFVIHRRDRSGRGGGVLLAIKENIQCQRRIDLETDCEILWCELNIHSGLSYFVGVFYRPPSSNVDYLALLNNSLSKLPSSSKIILLGDFNLPNIDWNLISPVQQDPLSDYFCDSIVNYCGLSQLVENPTRGNALLDLILTNTPENISNIDIDCGLGMSDHNVLFFDFNVYIPRPCQAPKIAYDYKNANWDGFRSDLSKAPWDSVFLDQNNIDQIWIKWKELFFTAVDNNIDKRHLTKKKKNVPWLTSAIRRLFHKRKRLWKKAKTSQLQSDWDKYKQCRNKVKSELNKSYWHHIQSLKNSENPKRFWTFIKSKTKSKTIPSEVSFGNTKATAGSDKAQLFNEFFASVFTESPSVPDQLRDDGSSCTDQIISSLKCCKSEVEKLLISLNVSKAHGPDGISARLLREAAPAISGPLTDLFNYSLHHGALPVDWKSAHVTPVFKKGQKELVENYRPISLTSLIIKTLERLIYNHIFAFVESNNLISDHQYGFRPGYSCTTQLIHLFHGFAKALDQHNSTDVIFLDFQKAFDSVPHNRLLLKLERFGIIGPLHSWLSAFLIGRFQRVVVEGCQSDWIPVKSGVPQGSILGPLLFILYVNDIPGSLSSHSVLFADDALIYDHCPPSSNSVSAQESLDQVNGWCGSWLLKNNADKGKAMKFTRAKNRSECSYSIDNKIIDQVSTHKHLGVVLSDDLSWKSHILSTVGRSNKLLGLLKRTFGSHHEALLKGYKVMVRPILEYACQVWNPHQKYLINKLESIQRNITRWIIGQDTPYEERIKSLKLHSLALRREFLSLIQLYKYINGLSAGDTKKTLSFCSRKSRNSHCYKLYKPYFRTDIFKYSFWNRYIDSWNNLPSSVVEQKNVNSFKNALKKHLFE